MTVEYTTVERDNMKGAYGVTCTGSHIASVGLSAREDPSGCRDSLCQGLSLGGFPFENHGFCSPFVMFTALGTSVDWLT